ncbi:hypothetical protein LNK15_15115, partial [Jeotgalicoccus huakuii]|nr:hypothetical protein [Jeotgalicoccus huakuii]
QTQRSVAYQALARLTGSPLASFDQLLAANLSPGDAPSADTLLDQVEQTAEWRLAAAQVERGEASLGSEKALRIPNLSVSL